MLTDQQRKAMFSSERDDWETPKDFFDRWNKLFHFNLDAAANAQNAKCEKYFTPEDDALTKSWAGNTVWLNPPYGRNIGKWVKKAYEESKKPNTFVVCLLPARTDTAWFHDYCCKGTVHFIRGRIKFGGCKENAPFPSMIVEFGWRYDSKNETQT